MKLKIFFLLLCLLCIDLKAQDADPSKIYIDDFDAFITMLEQTHPDPYTVYGGKVEFNRAVQRYREEVLKTTDKNKFYYLLNRFLSTLKDGHTAINNPQNNTQKDTRYLPLKFKIATDGIFVSTAAPEYEKYIGCRLAAVNNIFVDSLLAITGQTKASENLYGTYSNLVSFLGDNNSAARLFPGENKGLNLSLKNPDNTSLSIDVPFMDKTDFVVNKSKLEINKPNGLLYWQMIGDKKDICYFAWNSTSSREMVEQVKRDAPKYIEPNLNSIYRLLPEIKRPDNVDEAIKCIPSVFEQLSAALEEMKTKKSEYLIIDLRKNGGGMAPLMRPLLYMLYGDKFLDYDFDIEYDRLLSPLLLKKMGFNSIDEYNKEYNTTNRIGDYQFNLYLPSGKNMSFEQKRSLKNLTYFGLGARYVENLNGKSIYTPKIIVLTSPATFSAAHQFACILQRLADVKIVGVPSKQAGNSFMENTPFELPNTHLTGAISNAVQIFFPGGPAKANILMPDYPMNWHDFAKLGFDENAEILYTLYLIKNNSLKYKE